MKHTNFICISSLTRTLDLLDNSSDLYLALPWDEDYFYAIRNTYTDYYPDEVTIMDEADTVYHEINKTVTKGLHGPFFYIHDWEYTTDYSQIGNTHVRKYTYTINPVHLEIYD